MNQYDEKYNVFPNAIDGYSSEILLNVYSNMTKLRMFEDEIVKVADNKKIKVKVHMSSGQEAVAAALAEVNRDYQIFTQHRSMDTFLALGGKPEKLRDEILCLDTGCCGGQLGGGFQIHENGLHMFAHTGFIGENVSVGVGMALGNRKKTLCIFGDGAAEEDYVLEAMGFAATRHLPVLFLCTDNELSVLSPKWKRRSWELVDVARGFGLEAIDIADDPFTLMQYLSEFDSRLPALINVRVCRKFWHAGTGIDGPTAWDRYEIVKKQLISLHLEKEMKKIDLREKRYMEELWKDYR